MAASPGEIANNGPDRTGRVYTAPVPEPEMLWGSYARLVAVAFAIFFGSVFGQLRGLHSLYPTGALFERVRRDVPWPLRFVRYPTLNWLWPSATALQAQAAVGVAAAVAMASGLGPTVPLAFITWLMALSLANALSPFLCYPWDNLLLECGFLALFLPQLDPLPAVTAAGAPSAAIVLAHHLLLFRVILGMGKLKYLGPFWRNPRYIEQFMSFQPTPTRLAWTLAKVPPALFVAALYAMLVVEVVAPFLIWGPLEARVLAGSLFVVLMLAIAAAGNFGLFNLLTAIACLPLADPRALFGPQLLIDPVGLILLGVLVVGTVLYFPFDSWKTSIWIYSVPVYQRPWRWVRALLAVYRWLVPFHLVHAYGVFETDEDIDPEAPGRHWRKVLFLEGSADGAEWRPYRFTFQLGDPARPPRFFAPHQPRIDHHLYYEAWHMRFVALNGHNPYYWTEHAWLDRLLQRLLEGDRDAASLLGENPFPDRPPAQLRVRAMHCRYTTRAERRDGGGWYVQQPLKEHARADGLDAAVWELPGPESFHPLLAWWREHHGLAERAALTAAYANVKFDRVFWHALGYESSNIHVRRGRGRAGIRPRLY